MRVTVNNVIRITNPSKEILTWCKANLVLTNPEYTKKLRMHRWTGNTPAKLLLFETHGDELVIPFGCLRKILPMITDAPVDLDFQPFEFINFGDPIPLYSYQENAVTEAFLNQYGIIQSAAGSGKTQMGIALIHKFGKRALWLTHTVDLLNQSKERAERYMDKSLIGTITAGKVNIGSGITFATVQTMCRLDLSLYKNYWDVIIVDECHRVAGTPTAMTQFSKVLNSLAARHKYGLSATVHRNDGMLAATYALLGEVIHSVPDEAVRDKIMRVGIVPISTGTKISRDCLNTDGTLNYTKLITYLCEDFDRNALICNEMVTHSNHPALVLSDRLDHLELLMKLLPERMQPYAVMVSGKMTTKKGKAEREQAIADMRTGDKKYLFATYSLAKEGLDIPCLERLFLTTPQKDYAVIVQSVGRIARTAPDKKEPLCFDFVDDIPYLVKSYKKRCTSYKKCNCYFTTGGSNGT